MPEHPLQYHCRYFQDGPDNKIKDRRSRPPRYESILLIQRDGKKDSVTFVGDTRDEADAAMVRWIEEHNAEQIDIDAGKR